MLAKDYILPEVLDPADNPITAEKVELGRLLFWDPVLSGHKDVACATCHHPSLAYTDQIALSIGVGGTGLGPDRIPDPSGMIPIVKRNAQTVLNAAFNGVGLNGSYLPEDAPMFWDSRAKALEGQSLVPPLSLEEMRGHAYEKDVTLDSIIARLKKIPGYVSRFQNVFGGSDPVNSNHMAKAIGAFERTLVVEDSPFDRFAKGDANALSELERTGFVRFLNIGCTRCHRGPMFSDYRPHVDGVPDHPALAVSDSGINREYLFRTPTLRNLEATGPYFHNGVAETLEDVLRFYLTASGHNHTGSLQVNPNVAYVDEAVTDLTLTEADIPALVAFFRSLSSEGFDKTVPSAVPSGLAPGGHIQ
jgi:cytochrome c peroxidase